MKKKLLLYIFLGLFLLICGYSGYVQNELTDEDYPISGDNNPSQLNKTNTTQVNASDTPLFYHFEQ